MGNWYTSAEQPQQAEQSYRGALAIFERLAGEAPDAARLQTNLPVTPFVLDAARVRFDLAFTHFNLACLLRDLGRASESALGFGQALDHLSRLVREQPARSNYRHLLAKTHYELGLLRESDGQIDRAVESWRSSQELFEPLVREHPDTWVYRYNLALNLRCLSYIADLAGRPDEAEATRHTARDIEEKLVR
jgi:tetratricopeptide (TPR) repeat protein